jgi:hypothetical protein
MARPLLVVILAIILVGTWGNLAAAGEVYSLSKAYNMEKAERGWGVPSEKPSSVKVAADVLIGRPLGIVTTTAAAGVYALTWPFFVPSRSVHTLGWGVRQVGGWTFKRPLGQYDPRFSEEGIFR